jgi:hypothetical protein
MVKKKINKNLKLNEKKKSKSESIFPYLLIFIGLPFIFYYGLFALGGWVGIIIGVVLTLWILNKKWYS